MIQRNMNKIIWIGAIIVTSITGCTQMGSYDRLVTSELAKGKKMDSLFLGIKFGMTSKEFYAHCWELNKQGVITDGLNNTSVLYKLDSVLEYPASMFFYPDFYDNKISKMKVSFKYDSWAPWNRKLFSDSLEPRVLGLLMKWYGGNDFLTISDSLRGTVHVKVDGNRRIIVGKSNETDVKVDFSDLLVEKKIRKKHEQAGEK